MPRRILYYSNIINFCHSSSSISRRFRWVFSIARGEPTWASIISWECSLTSDEALPLTRFASAVGFRHIACAVGNVQAQNISGNIEYFSICCKSLTRYLHNNTIQDQTKTGSEFPYLSEIHCLSVSKTFNKSQKSCPGRTRTLTGGTRIRSATITPLDNSLFTVQR